MSMTDEKPTSACLLKFTPESWCEAERIRASLTRKARDNLHMSHLLQKIIDAGGILISAVRCTEKWGEVNTADDLVLCNHLITTTNNIIDSLISLFILVKKRWRPRE